MAIFSPVFFRLLARSSPVSMTGDRASSPEKNKGKILPWYRIPGTPCVSNAHRNRKTSQADDSLTAIENGRQEGICRIQWFSFLDDHLPISDWVEGQRYIRAMRTNALFLDCGMSFVGNLWFLRLLTCANYGPFQQSSLA